MGCSSFRVSSNFKKGCPSLNGLLKRQQRLVDASFFLRLSSSQVPSGKTTISMIAHKPNFSAFRALVVSPCAAHGTSAAAEASL
ncbi:hypothetical protein T02_13156 [Trichinella nativa]|uniref:Uncharacterized protein n=1 Tax=Trichinella nativa TaxID=6335 RepID=A0A0V1LI04_9BILA|nr:hypothetical protein T02_13156 [Trichinella nativa]